MFVRPRPRIAVLLATAMLWAACGDDTAAPTPTNDAPIVWGDPDTIVPLGDGWTAAPCGPELPWLCVALDGEPRGIIEVLLFPLDTLTDLQDRVASGEAATLLDAFVDVSFDGLGDDRSIACGAEYLLTEHEPAEAMFGGQPAVRYGFTGEWAGGRPSEMTIGYAMVTDEHLVLAVAAAHDPDGCIAVDELVFTSDDLTAVAPLLGDFVAALEPPAAPSPPG